MQTTQAIIAKWGATGLLYGLKDHELPACSQSLEEMIIFLQDKKEYLSDKQRLILLPLVARIFRKERKRLDPLIVNKALCQSIMNHLSVTSDTFVNHIDEELKITEDAALIYEEKYSTKEMPVKKKAKRGK